MKPNYQRNKKKISPQRIGNVPKDNRKQFKYDLTIGMIFRDDIKFIRKCLETMMPLREACNCQLIMTDTGSVDGSREVAEEFADIILDFEWCDDFSAARNTGIELAEGRWFAYFDCDQTFDESILEIAKFIKSEESYHYCAANIMIRDYAGHGETPETYSDSPSGLLHNFYEEKKYFVYAIHEGIMTDFKSVVQVPTLIEHWGYVGIMGKKSKRNIPLLLKLIESEPTNPKHRLQLIKETAEIEVREKRVNEALAMMAESDQTEDIYLCIFQLLYVGVCLKLKYYSEAKDTLALLESQFLDTSIELEYLGSSIELFILTKEYTKIQSYFNKFKALFWKLHEKPDIAMFVYGSYEFRKIENYHRAELAVMHTEISNLNLSYAKKVYKDSIAIVHKNLKGSYPFKADCVALGVLLQDFDSLLKNYDIILRDSDSQKEASEMLEAMERAYQSLTLPQKQLLLSSLKVDVLNSYSALMYLRTQSFSPKSYKKNVIKYLAEDKEVFESIYFSDLVHGYILNKTDPVNYIENSHTHSKMAALTLTTFKDTDIAAAIENTFCSPTFTIDTLQKEKLWAYVGSRYLAFLCHEECFDSLKVYTLLGQSTALMYGFISKVYNPYLISSSGKGILPEEEFFFYCIFEALSVKGTDSLAYVKKLNACLEYCPNHVEIIEHLLLLHQKELDPSMILESKIDKPSDDCYSPFYADFDTFDEFSEYISDNIYADLERDVLHAYSYYSNPEFRELLPRKFFTNYRGPVNRLYSYTFKDINGIMCSLSQQLMHLKSNIDKYISAYELLDDDWSRKTFFYVTLFQLMPYDISWLEKVRCDTFEYYRPELLDEQEGGVLLDCGAYDGKTALDYEKVYGSNYRHIYSFEPGPDNFELLQKNTSSMKNITLLNKGVGNEASQVSFPTGYKDSSRVIPDDSELKTVEKETEQCQVDIVRIDDEISEPITFLKMDIEGYEMNALEGAKNHIVNDRPQMAICLYHLVSDIYSIPLYLRDVDPNYTYNIRHHGDLDWAAPQYGTVLYAKPKKK